MRKSVLSFLLVFVLFGFSAFAGELYADIDTDYEYDDIYVEVSETDVYNEAAITLYNDSEDSIYVGTDSIIFICDDEGNPVEAADTFADELVELLPGETWTYWTGELPDDVIFAAGILVADNYGNLYTFGAGFGFAE